MAGFFDSILGAFDGMDPSIASAGIFSAASLVSQMFGQNPQEDALNQAQDQFEQTLAYNKENSANNLALAREELAAKERMAGAAAGATVKAAQISAGAQSGIAHRRNMLEMGESRVLSRDKAATAQEESIKGRPDIIMAGRTAQAQTARAAGNDGQHAFESLLAGIQAGLRR